MYFDNMIGAIVGVGCFAKCMFLPEYAIASVYLLEELGEWLN